MSKSIHNLKLKTESSKIVSNSIVSSTSSEMTNIYPLQDNQLLESTLVNLQKQFGKEAVMLLGLKSIPPINVFSSGSLIIDKLLGINGFPFGRIIEIFGPESSGKTTIALHAIKEMQSLGKICAFIDVEHALDPHYARKIGVNLGHLILSQPDSGELALELVDSLIKTHNVGLIIIDSVAALVPEVELNGEMSEVTVGAQARLMSKALRKITGILHKSNTTIIFINQIRSNINAFVGSAETTAGGKALRFYASIRLEVRKISQILQQQVAIGHIVKIKVVKNKLAPPFQVGVTEITFGEGISKNSELIELALSAKILERNGNWIKYQGQNLAQGKSKFKDLLVRDQCLLDKLLYDLNLKSIDDFQLKEAKEKEPENQVLSEINLNQ